MPDSAFHGLQNAALRGRFAAFERVEQRFDIARHVERGPVDPGGAADMFDRAARNAAAQFPWHVGQRDLHSLPD